MRPKVTTRVVLFTFVLAAGDVAAQAPPACPTPFTPANGYLTGAQLVSTLVGKYVCAKRSASETWDEFHRGAGGDQTFPIIEYKKGPNDPVDPSKVVGTYRINTSANTVTYDYGAEDPGSPYTYAVKTIPSPGPTFPAYAFCNIAGGSGIPAIVSATPGQAFCQ